MNKMICGAIHIFTIYVLLMPFNTLALTSAQENAAKRQDEINQQRLGRQRLDIINQRERKETEKIRESIDLDDTKNEPISLNAGGGCVTINTSSIDKNLLFFKEITKKILDGYKDQCFKKSDLLLLKQKIENYYISRGYSNTRVYFDTKSLTNSILSIVILEGLVENIKLNNNSKIDKKLEFREDSKIFTAFPFKKDKIFNIRDFEQGLDQINRLQSSNAKMRSDPGEKAGYSDVIIANEITSPTNIIFSYDNSGQESSGRNQKKIALSQDNLFGLYDNIYINYSMDDESDRDKKFTKSFYSLFSLPLGYWTFASSYSESQYLTTVDELNSSYKVSGKTLSKTFQIDRVLKRGRKFKINFGSELNLKDTASFIKDIANNSGTHKLSILTIFNENTIYTESGTLFVKPSYVTGLTAFNARQDLPDINNNEAHAQYELIKLYGYYNTNFTIPRTNTTLNYLFTLNSQLSKDTLYGTEKTSIGGRYSVRGFDENSISGDSGYHVRNDLKINLSYLLSKKLLNSNFFTFGERTDSSLTNLLSKTHLTIFYDYGYVRNKNIVSDAGEGYLSGSGAKLDYSGKYLDWDLTFSKGLHSPKFIQNIYDQQKDEESVYFNISAKFGLF